MLHILIIWTKLIKEIQFQHSVMDESNEDPESTRTVENLNHKISVKFLYISSIDINNLIPMSRLMHQTKLESQIENLRHDLHFS